MLNATSTRILNYIVVTNEREHAYIHMTITGEKNYGKFASLLNLLAKRKRKYGYQLKRTQLITTDDLENFSMVCAESSSRMLSNL